MREISLSAEGLAAGLLALPKERHVCLLDSCNVSHLGSHLLIAAFDPVEILEISDRSGDVTLRVLNARLAAADALAVFLTVSYDFGLKLNRIKARPKEFSAFDEPDVFLALFDFLIVHDYQTGKTYLAGNERRFDEIEGILVETEARRSRVENSPFSGGGDGGAGGASVSSNFTREGYIRAVEQIQEHIRRGDTYQTNLTRQVRARLPAGLTAERIFSALRRNHPAPFASFLRRKNDCVVSASPERFIRREGSTVSASPIKGTRPRGKTAAEDARLRDELVRSEKDRAENVMIVDLLRNDLGRICEYGSVTVEKLCELETHPTLYHLVSTVRGTLRESAEFSEILRAVFPCGSITGAPKIRTMRIIDEIETAPRGLSMGAVGYFLMQKAKREMQNFPAPGAFDLSVAIRTLVVRGDEAVFNVGGGVVIDSVPADEYEETRVKAKALLRALGAETAAG